MMLDFLETGKALYVLTAVCVLGILSRLTARNLYKRLIREIDNMTLTKNRWLRDLKQKAENTYRLNFGIHNTKAYLEKQLVGYRFLGFTLNGWGNVASQLTVLCFLLGGCAAFGAYWYRCDSYYVVLYGTIGVLSGLLTLFLDCGINLTERRNQLLNALQDYLENSLFNRLEREAAPVHGEEYYGGRGNKIRDLKIRNLNIRDLRNRDRADEDEKNLEKEPKKGLARDRRGRFTRFGAGAAVEGMSDTAARGTAGDRSTAARMTAGDRSASAEAAAGDRSAVARVTAAGTRSAATGTVAGAAAADSLETEGQTTGGAKRGPKEDASRRDVDYLKHSLEQIAASREQGRGENDWIRDLSPDELELVGEILKQYLA